MLPMVDKLRFWWQTAPINSTHNCAMTFYLAETILVTALTKSWGSPCSFALSTVLIKAPRSFVSLPINLGLRGWYLKPRKNILAATRSKSLIIAFWLLSSTHYVLFVQTAHYIFLYLVNTPCFLSKTWTDYTARQ